MENDMIRIGIICPSEIAFRRFMPAIQKETRMQYVGVAYATAEEWFGKQETVTQAQQAVIDKEHEKAEKFRAAYGGCVFEGYHAMLQSGEIDAVYLPLPPALHYRWAKLALEQNLHVLIEKPSTTCLADTEDLLEVAAQRGLAVHENYMFAYHSQLREVADALQAGVVGSVRLIRVDFGFPRRPAGDFRYVKALGGGALLDCGGYTLKYADMLLGGQATLEYAHITPGTDCDVEIFGNAVLSGPDGAQVETAFGMDNDYRCSINVWGSTGTLVSNRILTAPDGFVPEYTIYRNGEAETVKMQPDDTFLKSLQYFVECVEDAQTRTAHYEELRRQERLVDAFMQKAGM